MHVRKDAHHHHKKEEEEDVNRNERNNLEYKTECPIFNPNNLNYQNVDFTGKKRGVPTSLNVFDVESKPYYPSMDPNAFGGLLNKNKSKKQNVEGSEIKIEEVKESN